MKYFQTLILIIFITSITAKLEETPANKTSNKKLVKIFFLANSIAEDYLGVLTFIDKLTDNFDYIIGISFKGGASIAYYCEHFDNDVVDFFTYYGYLVRPGNGIWQQESGDEYTIKKMLTIEEWDYIVLQQYSQDADNYTAITEDPTGRNYHVQGLIDRIKSVVKHPFKLGWSMIPVRPEKYIPSGDWEHGDIDFKALNASYYKQVDVCQKLLKNYEFSFVIPFATAYMNAFYFGLTKLNIGNDTTTSYNWNEDGLHMRDGLPRLLESYMVLLQIHDLYETPIDLYEDKTTFTWSHLEAFNVIGRKFLDGYIYGLSDYNRFIAQKCAIKAYENKWEPSVIDP